VAPLWDSGFQQQTAKPGLSGELRALEAQPAIMCVENGANGSSLCWLARVLNAITVLDTGI
jgi:hypothetical protein